MVEGWRRWLVLTTSLAVVLVLYFTLPLSAHPDRSEALRIVLVVAFVGLATALVLWQVLLQLRDQDRHVDGLVFAMALAIVAFAAVFYGIDQGDPSQIAGLETRLDALYFTATTLMTIGYGDIHAAGQTARGVVLVQIVFNVAIIATAATTITSRVRQKAQEQAEARRHRSEERSTHRKPT